MYRYTREHIDSVNELRYNFANLPNKQQAWRDLIMLTQEKDSNIRRQAANAVGSCFLTVPDKQEAWEDIHELVQDKECDIRGKIAYALGSCFSVIPDKQEAWGDLLSLRNDKESDVRVSANYALGRASIFKAADAENEEVFRRELEKALEFFEKASNEAKKYNPAQFCLPFYRSFYTIAFKKQEAEAEVQKYLTQAKSAVTGSESKEKLLEVVENLSSALKEAQRALDFDIMKCDLNAYRRYCERAADLLDITEKKAPGATKLLKKGLPIIDNKIKVIFKEIEEAAKKFCKESRQTPFEKISRSAYNNVKGLGEIESPIEAEAKLNRLSPLLKSMCRILPDEVREVICGQLNEIEIAYLPQKANIIGSALSSIAAGIKNLEDRNKNLEEKLEEQKKWLEFFKNFVLQRLDNINYTVFQLKLYSGEIHPQLQSIHKELTKLKAIKTDLNNFGFTLTELGDLQHKDFLLLNNEITRLGEEIRTEILPKLSQTEDRKIILEKLEKLEEAQLSKEETWFNRAANLSSIISLLLTLPSMITAHTS